MPLVRYKPASRSISARPRRPTAPNSTLIYRVHHKRSPANRCVAQTFTVFPSDPGARVWRLGNLLEPRKPSERLADTRASGVCPQFVYDVERWERQAIEEKGHAAKKAARHADASQ